MAMRGRCYLQGRKMTEAVMAASAPTVTSFRVDVKGMIMGSVAGLKYDASVVPDCTTTALLSLSTRENAQVS